MVMDSIATIRLQQSIKFGLNCVATHTTVVVLILLDIVVITLLLIIDLCLPEDSFRFIDQCSNSTAYGNRYERMRQAQFILGIIQLTALSGFILEIITRVLVSIPSIIQDRWQVFDCLVVLVAFVLYVCLTVNIHRQTAACSAAYVISLRLWRIGRLYHVIQQKAAKHAESMMHIHVRTSDAYEEHLKMAQRKIAVQKSQMECLEHAVLCLKSVVYSNLTLSANRTRSLPAFTQEHTDISNVKEQEQSLTAASEFSIRSENLLHMYESTSELSTNHSCTQHQGNLDVPDILDNMKQEGQESPAVLGSSHLDTGCLHRHVNQNIVPCLILKNGQSGANSHSSLRAVAGLDNKISIRNFDQDPKIQTMESYFKSFLNEDMNSSYLNEAYNGEEDFNNCTSTSVLTKTQSRSEIPKASVMPTVLSQICTDDNTQAIERFRQVPFSFDHTRSYLSQDGIPMTDL